MIFFATRGITGIRNIDMNNNSVKKIFALILIALLSGFLYCSEGDDRLRPVSAGEMVWFDNLYRYAAKFRVDDADVILRSLNRGGYPAVALPAHLRQDRNPCILFISVRDEGSPLRVYTGSGAGFSAALDDCAKKIDHALVRGPGTLMRLDLVRRVFPPVTVKDGKSVDKRYFHRTTMGMALSRETGIALLPGEVNGRGIIDSEGTFHAQNLGEHLMQMGKNTDNNRYISLEKARIRPFVTETFFFNRSRTERLYRDHRAHWKISRRSIHASAVFAGDYLVNSTRDDGSFDYIYDAVTGEVSDDYNIIRHAGTVFSMLDLYTITKKSDLLEAAGRAVRYLDSQIIPFKNDNDRLCICHKGLVHLGGPALAALAMERYYSITGDKYYLERMRKLARYIVHEQLESGRFVHARWCPTFWRIIYRSPYYSGEAILALIAIYEADGNVEWLNAAEKGALYLIRERDAGKDIEELDADHWLLMALDKLHRHRENILFINHAMKLANGIVISQKRDVSVPDIMGSYYTPPGSTPTATRSEGLVAAYRLIRDRGGSVLDQKKYESVLKQLLETIHLNVHFQLNCQYDNANTFFLENPSRPEGGFRGGLADNTIRIDYVQHNLSSLAGLYHLLRDKPAALIDHEMLSYRLLRSVWKGYN